MKLVVFLLIQLALNSVQKQRTFNLFGSRELGYFYIEVYIGNPPQKQVMIIDTGSHLIITPCQPCSLCGSSHSNPLFNPRDSSTFQEITIQESFQEWICKRFTHLDSCQFEMNYSEGSSYKGYFAADIFRFENELGDEEA